jgi:hypothetical protein
MSAQAVCGMAGAGATTSVCCEGTFAIAAAAAAAGVTSAQAIASVGAASTDAAGGGTLERNSPHSFSMSVAWSDGMLHVGMAGTVVIGIAMGRTQDMSFSAVVARAYMASTCAATITRTMLLNLQAQLGSAAGMYCRPAEQCKRNCAASTVHADC